MLKKCDYKTMFIISIFLLGMIYYVNNNLNNEKLLIEKFENIQKNRKFPNFSTLFDL